MLFRSMMAVVAAVFVVIASYIEDGAHAKLLAQGGAYRHLWQMQAGGFLPEEDSPNSMVATA